MMEMHGNSQKNQKREQEPRDGKMKSQKEKVITIFLEDLLKQEKSFLKKKLCLKTLLKNK